VVGRGFTAPGGRPHAEVQALGMAGGQARGATAYVTLEPCSFAGKSGACTKALTEAGIARVVIGCADPNPKVNGNGIAQLRLQGIEIIENVLRDECAALIAGFAMTISENRPLVTLKLASSLDGKIATAKGESQWITGEPARRAAHALRGRHDAVMAGVGTVLSDDPELTCRIEGFRSAPLVRIVIDSHLRTPLLSKLVRGAAKDPLWILHRNGADKFRIKALESAGVKLIELPPAAAGVNLTAAAQALAKNGLTSVLAEGGGTLAAGLLRAGLADRLAWFHAPCVIGADGWPAAQGFGICSLEEMPRFSLLAQHRLGSDILSEYKKA
jgi:diaminohydroxyphosphoribosylaminopyrimidine deaminase / 5-amino-6-(5-phosphoribosylamino)uracil reductase